MTETQLTQIRNYLISRKLSIDVLMEVEDHFITQMTHLMEVEDKNFDEAFDMTKTRWISELKMTYEALYSFDDITPLMKKFQKEAYKTVAKKAIPTALIIILALFPLAYISTQTFFYWTLMIFYFIIIFAPLFIFIYHRKEFTLRRQYQNYTLTVFDGISTAMMGGIGAALSSYGNLEKSIPMIYNLLHGHYSNRGFVFLCFLIFIFFLISIIISSQIQYLKRLDKIKSYLKYL